MSRTDTTDLAARRIAARAWLAQEGGSCRVKLCGMFRDEDIVALNACRPHMAGFVCDFARSHRSVGAAELERLARRVDPGIWRVGVCVDLGLDQVEHNVVRGVDIVQLHGCEDDSYLADLRRRVDVGIVQAFRMRDATDVERALASAADMVLLDAGQGSGQTFDWSLVERVAARRPFILAGGLSPANVARAIEATHPWGVDMSSGIETNRHKDPHKMVAAVAAVRSAR